MAGSPPPPEHRIITSIFGLSRALAAEIRRAGGEAQLTLAQFSTLGILKGQDMSVGEVAKTLHVSMPTVTQIVDGLAGKGLVERQADERDRRQVRLLLTAEGLRVYDACHARVEGLVGSALTTWDGDRREGIATSLEGVWQLILETGGEA